MREEFADSYYSNNQVTRATQQNRGLQVPQQTYPLLKIVECGGILQPWWLLHISIP